MATITVLGAGMMGSALCVPLVDAGHDVRLVGTHLDAQIISELERTATHPKLKLELPRAIRPYRVERLGEALRGADVIGLGVSSAGVAWAAERLREHAIGERPVLMITKGLELRGGALRILPDVVADVLGSGSAPVAVAGPCIAGELARRVESCVLFTGRDVRTARELAALARTDYYHVFTSEDTLGVEVCAALKNAYAMGIGFAAGLHEHAGGSAGSVAMHNHEAAVFAQSVLEMQRVVLLCGGDPASASSLAGVGDLDVTCSGGRTGRFGRWLGLGVGLSEAVARMEGATLECLEILQVMRAALSGYEARGELGARELPLLRHLMSVALDDEAVRVPFGAFFGGE
jgi:glycerol-3-phosphate dehydrogenase (NAD(P)+)